MPTTLWLWILVSFPGLLPRKEEGKERGQGGSVPSRFTAPNTRVAGHAVLKADGEFNRLFQEALSRHRASVSQRAQLGSLPLACQPTSQSID